MVREECDHYWVLAGPQAVGHLARIKVRCIKCGDKGVAHLI